MDYAELNIDAAKSSLATIRDLHAIGLATDAELKHAQKLAQGVVVEVLGDSIKRSRSKVRHKIAGVRGIRAARVQSIGAAVSGRVFVRAQAQAGRETEISVNTLFAAMALSV